MKEPLFTKIFPDLRTISGDDAQFLQIFPMLGGVASQPLSFRTIFMFISFQIFK